VAQTDGHGLAGGGQLEPGSAARILAVLALPEPAHLFVVALAEAPRRGRSELDVVALGRQAAQWLGDDIDECQWNSPAIDSEAFAASGDQLQLLVQPEAEGYRLMLSSLTTGRTPRESKTRVLGQGHLRRRLRSAPRWIASELDWSLLPRGKLLEEVQSIVASIVEAPSEKLDFQRSFFDLGMDSVMIVRLAEQITIKSGMTLNAATIFDYEDASRLTNYLVKKLREANQPKEQRLAS
jgi:acyl carrier protein